MPSHTKTNGLSGGGRRAVTLIIFVLAIFSALQVAGHAQTSGKTPYDKDRLIRVVKLNALSTAEIVSAIQQRGVDFRMSPAIESEFRDAGARPEIIDAMRMNFRSAPSAAAPPPKSALPPRPPSSPGAAGVPAGPPLSKNEIVTMLQGGLPAARVEQFVEVRGVSFSLTPEISREITAAGGNRSLLGAISERMLSSTSPSTPATKSAPTAATAPDYDDLTDQAIAAMQSNNVSYAVSLLQKAVQMDPTKPTAFQLLGFAQLYGAQDPIGAERSMRGALERNGAAAFRVYHDHDGFFKTYCEGSLFVSRSGVTFKADDGNHTFATVDEQIKDTGMNTFFGSEVAAFHLKVYEEPTGKKDRKSKTYNFAPRTTKKAEANLILALVAAYN